MGDVDPAEDGPPETGIHRTDSTNGPLAVVRHQLPVFLDEAGGEKPPGLQGVALHVHAQRQKVAHQPVAPFQEQIDHHRHVVPEKHFAVVEEHAPAGVFNGCHGACQLAPHFDKGALKMGLCRLDDPLFLQAGAATIAGVRWNDGFGHGYGARSSAEVVG